MRCCIHEDQAHDAFASRCAFPQCHGAVVRVCIDPEVEETYRVLRELREDGHIIETRAVYKGDRPIWQYRLLSA